MKNKSKSNLCRNCYKRKSKIIWPELNELLTKIKQKSTLAVARELGVSDKAVEKHIKICLKALNKNAGLAE